MKKGVIVLVVALLLWAGFFSWTLLRQLPLDLSITGTVFQVPAESVTFLADRTYVTETSERRSEQEIFNEVLAMISRAQNYIVLDMFLYNDYQGVSPERTRALSSELTAALIAKKKANPQMAITVISDPVNTVYGGSPSAQFEQLKEVGVDVFLTDLTKLPDSNPLYATFWRTFVRQLGNGTWGGWLPHPFASDGERVTLRSWLALFNFKANHRKVVVADETQSDGSLKMVTLVTSANPHDGSSAHSNVALKVTDGIWRDALRSEYAVTRFSGEDIVPFKGEVADLSGPVAVQLLTEGAIERELLKKINLSGPGDTIDMAMFYLADRDVVKGLLAAAERDVVIRLILDPNKDAFGHTKNGVPNRPVAAELQDKAGGKIAIRWCNTHGEQCHSKLVIFSMSGEQTLLLGSANLTKRNIGDLNLETNVAVSAGEAVPAIAAARTFFEQMWHNQPDRLFTTDYTTYEDDGTIKKMLYRFQEFTGLSSF